MKYSTLIIFIFYWFSSYAQNEIHLKNPSFEGIPRVGTINGTSPIGWFNCNHKGESAPDIQPGFFKVNKPAINGDTYLGLVTRDNSTNEGVSQKLDYPLKKGENYIVKIFLARSDGYKSPSRVDYADSVFHTEATILRIYGGDHQCDCKELLTVSPAIAHTEWKDYAFLLQPNKDHSYMTLEAFFSPEKNMLTMAIY